MPKLTVSSFFFLVLNMICLRSKEFCEWANFLLLCKYPHKKNLSACLYLDGRVD